ncbi:MAG: helicase C-terminal domain-containing protein [bacterium]
MPEYILCQFLLTKQQKYEHYRARYFFRILFSMNQLHQSIESFFSEDGSLSKFEGYEFRPQQLEMAKAIASVLEEKKHLIVEAPTGVGKSLAYLTPCLLYALENKRKAIVSTHTKNLQEQLFRKDIPIVRSLIEREFFAVVLKGRKNYLCTTRLQSTLHQQKSLFAMEERNDLASIEEWAKTTVDGDVENLGFVPDPSVWQQVCSEKGACGTKLCGGHCFFQQAKQRARDANLVIMNHALFFTLYAMLDLPEGYLFKDDFVIFDEAHTLEQAAGSSIGSSLSRAQVLFAIHRLYNPKTKKGILAKLRTKHHKDLCMSVEQSAEDFFETIRLTVRSSNPQSNTIRIRTPRFVLNTLSKPLHDLQSAVKELEQEDKSSLNNDELLIARRLLWEAEIVLDEFMNNDEPSLTRWVEFGHGRYPNIYLNSSPIDIAESIGARLFREGMSCILTSATLSINKSTEYFQSRLGAGSARSLVLDSPFDFQRQMRIVLAKDIPLPDNPRYKEELPDWILRAILRSDGRALVLFTNAQLLRTIAGQLHQALESEGITLLVQDGKQPRHRLLQQFKEDIHSVLFGLDSFWMGVDVPGEALEHVIITKLPFAVPDHPLIESRIEQIEQRGGTPFFEFTLPEAIIKLRQGVGRLIRLKTDKGMITILDSRVVRKSYGSIVLKSFPRCPVEFMNRGDIEQEEVFLDES